MESIRVCCVSVIILMINRQGYKLCFVAFHLVVEEEKIADGYVC